MGLTLAGLPAAANDGAIAYDGMIMMFSRMTSAGLVAAGLLAGAALVAAPAGADPTSNDAGGTLDSPGLGSIDPGNAAEFAQSICPMLAEPGQQVADAAAQASGDAGQPLPGTMFAGAAISMFCPAAINSMANGQSPIPLPMLSGLGNLGGFGN